MECLLNRQSDANAREGIDAIFDIEGGINGTDATP